MSVSGLTQSEMLSDVRAEVVATSIVENGNYTIDQIVVNPVGGNLRSVRRDIQALHEGRHLLAEIGKEKEHNDLLFIDVSRPGVYDYLPEGFFHQSAPTKTKRSVDDSLDEMKAFKLQERSARVFFLTMEKEINRARIVLEMEERKSMLGFSEHYKTDLFLRIWPQLKGIDQRILVIIFQLLPISHIISNNFNLLSIVLGAICGKPVSVTADDRHETVHLTNVDNSNLGLHWLGVDTVLGDTVDNYDPVVNIEIQEVRRNEMSKFLFGGDLHNVITLLLEFFLPSFVERTLLVRQMPFEEDLVLADGESDSYLGYNSCI